jgi:hypothetical protein
LIKDPLVLHNFKHLAEGTACGTANKAGTLPLEGTGQVVVTLPGIEGGPHVLPAYYSSKVRRGLLSVHELDEIGIKNRDTEGYLWQGNPENRCAVRKVGKKYHVDVKFHLPTSDSVVNLLGDSESPVSRKTDSKAKSSLAHHEALCHATFHPACEACAQANVAHTKGSLPPPLEPPREKPGERPSSFGDVLLLDGIEDREETLVNKRKHMWIVKDRATGWVEALFTGDKKRVGIKSLEAFERKSKATGAELSGVQTYGDGAYCTEEVDEFCKSRGGFNRPSRSLKSKEHAEIERGNRQIQKQTRATLIAASMPVTMWNLAAAWVLIAFNYWGTSYGGKTPYELRYDQKSPAQDTPPKWGEPVWWLDERIWTKARKRFGSRAPLGWFVGIDRDRKSWLILSRPNQTETGYDEQHASQYVLKRAHHVRFIGPQHGPPEVTDFCGDVTETTGNNTSPLVEYGRWLTEQRQARYEELAGDQANLVTDEGMEDVSLITDEEMVKLRTVPPDLKEKADEEIAKHVKYGALHVATAEQVTNAKKRRRFAKGSFYHKVKRNRKVRLRLACQGFRFLPLPGYASLYTSMSSWEYICVTLSFYQAQLVEQGADFSMTDHPDKWILICYDVVSAFLQCKLGLEDSEQPVIDIEGYGSFRCAGGVNGVKEAPRAWQRHRNKVFRKHDLLPCATEPAVFKKVQAGRTVVLVLTHVDDFIVVGRQSAVETLFAAMSNDIEITRTDPVMLGPGVELHDIVGADVVVDTAAGTVYVSMVNYVDKAAVRLGHAKYSAEGKLKYEPGWEPTPHPPHQTYTELETDERDTPSTERLALQGTIGWAVGRARWELKIGLKVAASCRSNVRALALLKDCARAAYYPRVLVFNGDTPAVRNLTHTFAGGVCEHLYGESDADFATCTTTRKSIGAGTLYYNGNLIVAFCQSVGACDSSTQAEVSAAHELTKRKDYILPLIRFLGDGGTGSTARNTPGPQPRGFKAVMDSQPAYKALRSLLLTKATKHYGVKLAVLRDAYFPADDSPGNTTENELSWVPRTQLGTADYFTHILNNKSLLLRTITALGFTDLPGLPGRTAGKQ